MEEIEETDDLLELDYLNDGFDDIDCDVDDSLKKEGKVGTGKAKVVEENLNKPGKEQDLLDYSDFFGDDKNDLSGEKVMDLKPIPVLRQSSQDHYDSNIFPLPQSERRHQSPQVDDIARASRSSQDMHRVVSPITVNSKPKLSKALSKKIANRANKDNMSDKSHLPSIHRVKKKPPKKFFKKDLASPPQGIEEKSIASANDAAREHRLPHIGQAKKRSVPSKKKNQAEIAKAKEKYLKAKKDRMAAHEMGIDFGGKKPTKEPVSPRINFKYDSRLGLFGFDIEAERQSKRENYELMRIAKKNEEFAEIARARAHVKYGAGVMDAKTFLPGDLEQQIKAKPKPKKVKNGRIIGKAAHDHGKLRSKSDFKGNNQRMAEKARRISSENRNMEPPHSIDENDIVSSFNGGNGNGNAMQCSPIDGDVRKKRKKSVQMNPVVVMNDAPAVYDDFYNDGSDFIDNYANDDVLEVLEVNDHDKDHPSKPKRKGTPPPAKTDVRDVKMSPLRLSAIKKAHQQEIESNPESDRLSLNAKPKVPKSGDKKESFQRNRPSINRSKPAGAKSRNKKKSKSPRRSPRKKSPCKVAQGHSSPGKGNKQTKFDIDVFDSVAGAEKSSPPKVKSQTKSPTRFLKKSIKEPKKSIADELFEEFEAFNLNDDKSTSNYAKSKNSSAVSVLPMSKTNDNEVFRMTSPSSPQRSRVDKEQMALCAVKSEGTVDKKKDEGLDDYNDDGFDDYDEDVLFDFSHRDKTDEEKALNEELSKKAQEEAESIAREKAVKEAEMEKLRLENEKRKAVEREEQRKARQLAKEKEEAERIKRQEEIARDESERLESERMEERRRQVRLDEEELARKEREQVEREMKKEEERLALIQAEQEAVLEKQKEKEAKERAAMERQQKEIEDARIAAEEKEEEERRKRIMIDKIKEEKLQKAANLELEILPNVIASPKNIEGGNDEMEEINSIQDDNYNFDEDFEDDPQVKSDQDIDSSSPVLFEINSPIRTSVGESDSKSHVVSPKKDSEPASSKSTIVVEEVGLDNGHKSKDDDDVLFDFNKPQVQSPVVEGENHISERLNSPEGNPIPNDEEDVVEDYESDYDDDFD